MGIIFDIFKVTATQTSFARFSCWAIILISDRKLITPGRNQSPLAFNACSHTIAQQQSPSNNRGMRARRSSWRSQWKLKFATTIDSLMVILNFNSVLDTLKLIGIDFFRLTKVLDIFLLYSKVKVSISSCAITELGRPNTRQIFPPLVLAAICITLGEF